MSCSIISSRVDTDVSSVSNFCLFVVFSSKFGRGFYGTCGYNTYSYGHIRIRYVLLRIERIDTKDLSAASVPSVYASVTIL